MFCHISVTKQVLNTEDATVNFTQHTKNSGAIVNFLGKVRPLETGVQLAKMHLEHFPGVTENAIQTIIDQASTRWQLEAISVIHRVGVLLPHDNIVFIQVAAKHRQAAFAACEFIMDYLKTEAPFWKKEVLQDQSDYWVEAKNSDQESLKRWQS